MNRVKRTLESFIKQLEEMYLDKYDFSKITEYKNNKTKVVIIDKLGIEYNVRLNDLQQGYEPTVLSAVNKTDWFIKQSKSIFHDKFNYSNTIYNGAYKYTQLICNKCNLEFGVLSRNHLGIKTGCPNCFKLEMPGCYPSLIKKTPDKLTYLYFVKLFNNEEEFFKIGLTTNKKINKRMNQIPYKYEIIKVKFGKAIDMFKLEQRIHNYMRNKNLDYQPKIFFAGYTECFKLQKISPLNLQVHGSKMK